jgi:hypothetical protein
MALVAMLSRARVITRCTASRKIGYGLIVVLACFGRAATVAAQRAAADVVDAHLVVEADARCATTASIASQVRARSRRIAFVDTPDGVPSLRIAIGEPAGGERVATLVVRWPDGRSAERRLSAASCASAGQALALLVAMTLDPSAFADAAPPAAATANGRSGGGSGSTDGDDDESNDTGGATPAGETTASEADTQGEAPASDTPPADAAAAAPQPPESTAATTAPSATQAETAARDDQPHPLGIAQLALGASAQLSSGPAPSVMPGVGLYARLSLHGWGIWTPALQLQLARTWLDDVSETGGDADFAIESAALDACPLGVRIPPLSAHACVAATLGRLTARGSNSYAPRAHHEPWSSLGGRLLVAVGLGAWAELHAGLGLLAPLRRYRFAFRPDVFHRVPGVCLEGQLGAGVRFW